MGCPCCERGGTGASAGSHDSDGDGTPGDATEMGKLLSASKDAIDLEADKQRNFVSNAIAELTGEKLKI